MVDIAQIMDEIIKAEQASWEMPRVEPREPVEEVIPDETLPQEEG